MAPPKWDDEEETSSGSDSEASPPPVTAARRKFDDEEDSDEVLDSWDAAEDSEVEREKAKKAAAVKAKAEAEAAANKKSRAQRVEEHREANRRRRAAEEEESSEEDEDETAHRARLRKSEQDADLGHAENLLNDTSLSSAAGAPGDVKSRSTKATVVDDPTNPGQTLDLSSLPLFKPSTKPQFDALSTALSPLLAASSTRPHYSLWAQDFVKKVCEGLPSAEIKKAASGLTALSNEKLKEEKAQEKGGKKSKAARSKATLVAGRDVGRGVADVKDYGGEELGDDDFM